METGSLIRRLREYRPQASEAELNIVDFILTHPKDAVGKSVRELADLTFASPSTIVRFCQRAGCSGYKEFQRCLVYEVALSERNEGTARLDATPEDSTEDLMRKVMRRNITALETTRHLLEPRVVDECVELMMSCDTICLFGIGASLLVAKDLQLKLLRVDKPCNLCDDWNAQLLYAKNMEPNDLGIVFSYSGLTQEMVECAKVARGNGAKVIAVTRTGIDSRLVRESDIVLPVASTEAVMRSGASSSRISQLGVVDVLYSCYVNRDYERCTKGFRKNFISKENSEQ